MAPQPSGSVAINGMSSSIGEHVPSFLVVTFIPSAGTDVGKVWVLGLGRRWAEPSTKDVKRASCEENSSVRVGMCWRDWLS